MRSALSIAAGYLVLTLALFGLFAVWFLDAPAGATLDPGWGFIAVAVVWGFVSAGLGAIVTGALAKSRPFEHSLALALVTGLIGVASMAASFGEQPVGFQLMNLLVLMAGCVAGGWLRRLRAGALTA